MYGVYFYQSNFKMNTSDARDGSFYPEVKSVFNLPFMTKPPFYIDIPATR